MTASTPAPAAAPWTRFYWPAALAVSVVALIALPDRKGPVILAGAVLLGLPEAYFLIRRQWSSTLSDWFWRVLHVTRHQPVSQWKADHFLALGLYVAVAVDVTRYEWTAGYWQGAVSTIISVWLTWHLFGRWWR